MTTIHITNISELFRRLPMHESHTMLFRGQSDASLPLVPSVGRPIALREDLREDFEQSLVSEFKRRALPFLKVYPRSDLEWMFLAQHYGIPTRLLDWTTNPLVAAYFAIEKDLEKEGAIFQYIHTIWLEDIQPDFDPFAQGNVLALRPMHTDARYVNQSGVFTMHPLPQKPFEPPAATRFVIPGECKEILRWHLRKLGMGAAFIYPSLEGVAMDIKADLAGRLTESVRITLPIPPPH